MINADLHSHSTVSDGLLAPEDVTRKAVEQGVELYALTDHDDVRGLERARAVADAANMRWVSGVEISVTWEANSLHIVGLNFDHENRQLVDALAGVRAGRRDRARRMADELARAGIPGTLEGADRHVPNPEMIARSHFARYLVECGIAPDVKSVFRHYLAKGKPGYVAHQWATLSDAVRWIRDAGGVAVIAHPGRYSITEEAMERLLAEFREMGGEAVEVVTSNHTPEQVRRYARLAQRFGFAASRGSDYHGPGESYALPGRMPPLPIGLTPVWSLWQ